MSDQLKSIVFALVVAVVCSLLLTVAASGLKRRQLRNMEIDKQKNLLKSVGLIEGSKKYASDEIETLYKSNIFPAVADSSGNISEGEANVQENLPIYLYKKDDAVIAYIIPLTSKGLWGKIYGYIAVENDGSTLLGFTVYKHNETPGLGGEIQKGWFQENFKGKKIVGPDGTFTPVAIAKGKSTGQMPDEKRSHFVDGISGATLTGKFLSEGLKEILLTYEPVSNGFRNN